MSDLEQIFDRQRELQVTSYGGDPAQFQFAQKIEYLRWNYIALVDELHEALAETSWKPWQTAQYINQDAFRGEMVDALHFFVNMCLATDIKPEELLEGYLRKANRNGQRMAEGYTGLEKCPQCRRALDDEAVLCTANECRY